MPRDAYHLTLTATHEATETIVSDDWLTSAKDEDELVGIADRLGHLRFPESAGWSAHVAVAQRLPDGPPAIDWDAIEPHPLPEPAQEKPR